MPYVILQSTLDIQERQSRDPIDNFKLVVKDLISHVPGAIINRGAYYIRENADQLFAYPSKNAFFEEMIWLLWRAQNRITPLTSP